jgi:hypothetical protein
MFFNELTAFATTKFKYETTDNNKSKKQYFLWLITY